MYPPQPPTPPHPKPLCASVAPLGGGRGYHHPPNRPARPAHMHRSHAEGSRALTMWHRTPAALLLLLHLLLLGPPRPGTAEAPNYMICGSEPAKSLPFCNTSLPRAQRVADMLSRMTLVEKCTQVGDAMGDVPSIGWRGYNWNTECLHGLGARCLTVGNVTRCPTIFAAPPGLGATFNRCVRPRARLLVRLCARDKFLSTAVPPAEGRLWCCGAFRV